MPLPMPDRRKAAQQDNRSPRQIAEEYSQGPCTEEQQVQLINERYPEPQRSRILAELPEFQRISREMWRS